MKKNKLLSLTISAIILCGFTLPTACAPTTPAGNLKGTALAEALLAKERINHKHLSQSFDFLDNRLKENQTQSTKTELTAYPLSATALNNTPKSGSSKGGIISGSGDTAVYSWSNFEQLATELSYFQSHFSAGQNITQRVDDNISVLENFTDIKDKWIDSSYIRYLMEVEENREVIYASYATSNDYSVGIRSVNKEVNTTYEYYEKQGNLFIRTLATQDRRYEYTTANGADVMAFVADNDLGYWRFVQLYSSNGETLHLNVMIMTDNLAYSFRYDIYEDYSFPSEVTLISPDLKYEIAKINGEFITVFPGSYKGINELRVSAAEQKEIGKFGKGVGYTKDHGYYSTEAAPHIYTNNGVIAPPVEYEGNFPGVRVHPTVLDENVSYTQGDVRGLWEQVYPSLTFSVTGDTVQEQFDNLHNALATYGITPLYNKNVVGKMADDVFKLVDGFTSHYVWNGNLISNHTNAMTAYRAEKEKANVYESMFNAAKLFPVASENELLQAKQNASLPDLILQFTPTVSVYNSAVTVNGLSAKVEQNDVLESTATYVLKLALKKNTNGLEELAILDNLDVDTTTVYSSGDLSLTLSGDFGLSDNISEGEYSLVVYAANAADGIRISKFKEVACVGDVNSKTVIDHFELNMIVTPNNVFKAICTNLFDVNMKLADVSNYAQLVVEMENAIISNGYFVADAVVEYYHSQTESYLPFDKNEPLSVGTYRIEYLAKSDGGEVTAHVYCEIK